MRAGTTRHRPRAATAALALALALVAGGCGRDDEPRSVAATTATTAGDALPAPADGEPATSTAPPAGRSTSTTTAPRAGRSTGTTSAPGGRSTTTATTPAGRTATTPAGRTATTPRAAAPPARPAPRTATTPTRTVAIPPARARLGRVQRFTGTGDVEIGELELDRTAVVRWTVSGGRLELRDGAGTLAISGRGERGQSFAAAGSYRSVTVAASGRWTLTFTALGS